MSTAETYSLESNVDTYADTDDYRSLSRSAVFGMVLGVLGLLSLIFAGLILLPVAGLFFAISAWYGILKYPTELSGKPLALAALALNLGLAIVAPIRHAYIYATEVPDGFERISFSMLKSPMGAPDAPTLDALNLDGKKIFLKGYIHPTSISSTNAKNFVLVPDWGTCCFGGQPPLTHMVQVNLGGDMSVKMSQRKLKLAGTFKVDKELKPISGLEGVYYQLQADYLK